MAKIQMLTKFYDNGAYINILIMSTSLYGSEGVKLLCLKIIF